VLIIAGGDGGEGRRRSPVVAARKKGDRERVSRPEREGVKGRKGRHARTAGGGAERPKGTEGHRIFFRLPFL
jgi:hypothetical protein